MSDRIPRDKEKDFTVEMATTRRKFVEEKTGTKFDHVGHYSFDPGILPGNVESFIGVAQVPIGLAGPLLVNGEHAKGDFYIPMATAEGTLVASYNRGMRVVRAAGGVTATVLESGMQRCPVFVFKNALEARDFGDWIKEHFEKIKEVAESTTSSGKLKTIEQYAASKVRFLRFNYLTGDAAGQNMVGKATDKACKWIESKYKKIERYYLTGNMDTDKKHSWINTLHTRGKRVVAEVTIPADLLVGIGGEGTTKRLYDQRMLSNLGALMAGSNNNGAHSPNGITAIMIATGQDVANVTESSAAFVYVEITPEDEYYFSITLPSLIIATYGGGTGLATQKECLESMDCYGSGKVNKFAEIVAATVLCGEISLATAVVSGHWVSSHDELGRNRP